MRRSVTVTIAGQRYVLKSDAEETYVHKLASYVSEKFKDVQRSTKQVATHQVAVLAALQIADELFRERKERAELRGRVRSETRRLLEAVSRETRL